VLLVFLVLGLLAMPHHLASTPATSPDFVHFESGHVHPAAMTPDGERLLVVNTADNRLTVFSLAGAAPARLAEIPVGLEPVSVACLDDQTAWVVNHLSDDVSIVDLATLHVRATLRVGDEPGDVVFAGTPPRAYVSIAQEDRIRIYDPAALAAPPVDVAVDGNAPRALARSADGAFVYAAMFTAGNRTSTVPFQAIPVGAMPLDPVLPRNPTLPPPPRVALMVQQQGAAWRDMYGNDWTAQMPFSLSEIDVAEISTASRAVTRTFGDLGTLNFGLAVSPADGRIAVTSTEARNLLRFTPRLRGHAVDTQLGLIAFDGTRTIRNLNPHVNYAIPTGNAAERDSAIGFPTAVAFSPAGDRVYVTSLASDRLAVLDAAGSGILARVPTVAGPTGLVVDAARGRLYVVGRFRNQLQTFSATDLAPLAVSSIGFDPTPDAIVNGRRFLYGGFTSAHGEQACATCHPFGDMDEMAWDLGDPNGVVIDLFDRGIPGSSGIADPMKGPLMTQTLRGLPGTGRLHWRADRPTLASFNVAFVELMGLTAQLPDSEMAAFMAFVNPLVHPPNPNQVLDRSFPDAPLGQPSVARGDESFRTENLLLHHDKCTFCHSLPPGTNGQISDSMRTDSDQDLKVPHLRNLYRKTGLSRQAGAVSRRGFGFSHDGEFSTLVDFLRKPVFTFSLSTGDAKRRDLEAFMLQFDTGMAPAVGRQITFDGAVPSPAATSCLDTLCGQAGASACQLVAHGRIGGQPRSWLYQGNGSWRSDRALDPAISTAQLVALAMPGGEITVTGVPLGTGLRSGLDRDRDGFFDGDELRASSDPGDPQSTPGTTGVPRDLVSFALRSIGPNPFREATEVHFSLGAAGPVDLAVFDVMGREVRRVATALWLDAGPQSLKWDGRAADGRSAGVGVYFVRLSAAAGHWSRPVIRMP